MAVVKPKETIVKDQMAVKVTEDVPTAVLRSLDEGSTAAALAQRMPSTSTEINPATRMVLVPGSMFADDTDMTREELDDMVNVTLNGGYLAMERLNVNELFNFTLLYLGKLLEKQILTYQDLYDMDEATARRAARSSEIIQRTQARLANIREVARTRGEGSNADDVQAEMLIIGTTDYYMQEAFKEETAVTASETDSEGNTTEAEETVKQERTAAISGELADATAEWLNDVEKEKAAASRRAMTRGGSSAVNEIMDASETFTFNGNIYFPDNDGTTEGRTHRLSIKVSSWGIHNMESNKDYYYLKENVLMSLGPKKGYYQVYWPLEENWWYDASGYGEYNNWFGAFFSQYKTSMNLTGSGSITLEASSPATDNNNQTTSITIGSSSSTTTTSGVTWGVNGGIGPTGPSVGASVGGSYSKGHTTGSSFSMGMSQSSKDLKVKRNTDGKKVTWTYDGTLPQYYEKITDRIRYCHQQPADILVNDVEMNQEICWSVSNPSGQYTVEVTSAPKLAALLYVYKKEDGYTNAPHKYVDRSDNQTYTHTLLEPFRKMQTWRMNIENVEYVGVQHYGNLTDLQNAVEKAFPDLYVPVFEVADYDEESLNVITSVIKYSKSIFEQRSQMLEDLAQQYGIKKFEIVWSRDKIKSKDAFTIYVCPKATEATQAHVGWVYGSDGRLYPSADYAKGHEASAVGIVAYVNDGSDFGNGATEKASGAGHGLVLALNQVCNPKYSSANYLISKGSGTFDSAIGNSMDNAKNDFDGLAKTKHLKEVGTEVGNIIGYMGAAPTGGTDWFIPSTGQWIAMLCKRARA